MFPSYYVVAWLLKDKNYLSQNSGVTSSEKFLRWVNLTLVKKANYFTTQFVQ
ncbi:unnamed protein product [marine sediment metagenome]|uniref:Uncharacterized protein n=1 Tax=marine sediment metagenome TaxID=412755 RepID=X1BVI9_9ZZZZ